MAEIYAGGIFLLALISCSATADLKHALLDRSLITNFIFHNEYLWTIEGLSILRGVT
jgi:hypothetical protein